MMKRKNTGRKKFQPPLRNTEHSCGNLSQKGGGVFPNQEEAVEKKKTHKKEPSAMCDESKTKINDLIRAAV